MNTTVYSLRPLRRSAPEFTREAVRRHLAQLCVIAVCLATIHLFSAEAAAQPAPDPLLRKASRDKAVIAAQTRAALPRLERAVELITASQDPQAQQASKRYVEAAYAYLRAAQENAQMAIATSKYPDPILTLQKDRTWVIRRHLLDALQIGAYPIEGHPTRTAEYIEHLTDALRKLRILVSIV